MSDIGSLKFFCYSVPSYNFISVSHSIYSSFVVCLRFLVCLCDFVLSRGEYSFRPFSCSASTVDYQLGRSRCAREGMQVG